MVVESTSSEKESCNDADSIIGSKSLQRTLMVIEPVIGRAVTEELILNLESGGISLANDNLVYTLEQIQKVLEKSFGEATPFLMQRIKREIAKQE